MTPTASSSARETTGGKTRAQYLRWLNSSAAQSVSADVLRRYAMALGWTDFIAITAVVFVAQSVRFGFDTEPSGSAGLPVTAISICLIVAWMVALRVYQTLDRRVIGSGSVEYSRVVSASLSVFGVLAILALALQLDVSRGFFAMALPVGTVALLVSRWLWRKWLARRRSDGDFIERVLVVGETRSATHLISHLVARPELGLHVAGACLPTARMRPAETALIVDDAEVGVFGDFDDVGAAVQACGASVVAVTSAEALGHAGMRELSWDLEKVGVSMMVSPGITDIAGPRMMVRPVAGLPLLHIDKPQYEAATRFRKALVDRGGATVMMLLIAPVLALIALLIKLDSPGPVFYRATRVGMGNAPFRMWKFRSMYRDAELRKQELLDQNEGSGVLFKIHDDPRVTRFGKLLRRYSIDELPQLLNVLGGTMSLVGPRPPLPEEVELYDGRVARRMLVKPGMTGLWQVSGRSNLSWEESVHLDLSYVENWSIMGDAAILWRTVKAVVTKEGAY